MSNFDFENEPLEIQFAYQCWQDSRANVDLWYVMNSGTTTVSVTDEQRLMIHALVSEEMYWELKLVDAGYMVTADGCVYPRESEV